MPTANEIIELVNYVFDEIAPKVKDESREEFAYVLMDEMVDLGWLDVEDELDEEDPVLDTETDDS